LSAEPGDVTVRGGTIDAQTQDIRTLAHVIDRTGTDLTDEAIALHGQLVDVRGAACALADPIGFGWFETELVSALDGPGGLTTLAAACMATSQALRIAAGRYDDADVLPLPDLKTIAALPGAITHAAAAFSRGGGITNLGPAAAAGFGAFFAEAPSGVDDVVYEVRRHVPSPVADLMLGTGDGRPIVTDGGTDPAAEAGTPPRGVADLMRGLSRRNQQRGGDIDVRILRRPDGSRAAVVDIPGTKSWTLGGRDVTDLTTNIRAIGGRETAYERGVLNAMERAGITPDEPVLLIGHSEGGMVAVNAALHNDGRFRITHVVTAGAPIGDSPSRTSTTSSRTSTKARIRRRPTWSR
jgi:hypothetical protein